LFARVVFLAVSFDVILLLRDNGRLFTHVRQYNLVQAKQRWR